MSFFFFWLLDYLIKVVFFCLCFFVFELPWRFVRILSNMHYDCRYSLELDYESLFGDYV